MYGEPIEVRYLKTSVAYIAKFKSVLALVQKQSWQMHISSLNNHFSLIPDWFNISNDKLIRKLMFFLQIILPCIREYFLSLTNTLQIKK